MVIHGVSAHLVQRAAPASTGERPRCHPDQPPEVPVEVTLVGEAHHLGHQDGGMPGAEKLDGPLHTHLSEVAVGREAHGAAE